MPLRKLSQNTALVDGENRPIRLDHAYALTAMRVDHAIDTIRARHGSDICLLPLSAASAGAGVFQVPAPAGKVIIGLQLSACAVPAIKHAAVVDITQVALDEIIIDTEKNQVYAGSAINLNQLNLALSESLGADYRVLGADLTSYCYAQVGATFMTGGMGPQRRYFSDSVCQIALHDGTRLLSIEGKSLTGYAGTYGWSGLVSAVCCHYYRLPKQEIALVIPVNSTPKELSRLLQHLSPFAYLEIPEKRVQSVSGGQDLVLGLEHITLEAMRPFLTSGENALVNRARQLKQNCDAANADGLIFVSAYSDLETDEFLFKLVDDATVNEFTIAGISLEYTEVFKDPEQMRAIREGIPLAARMQSPRGQFVFKGHTDATIMLNRQCVETAMMALWQANQNYVQAVQEYFDKTTTVRGEILVYGHLNPVGVDPHNRITMACDQREDYHRAVLFLEEKRNQYMRCLAHICKQSGSAFIGGEKSAGSNYEIFPAFGTIKKAPSSLRTTFKAQSSVIQAADKLYRWRAMKPYV